MALVYKTGSIFDSNCQTLVNTVNCQGVMGKGLAKQFKQFFPTMYYSYVEECKHGTSLKHGGDLWVYSYENTSQMTLWEDLDPNCRSKILCFATKEHWKNKSHYQWIIRGLHEFRRRYKEWGITSVAFPKLGCTNGGLSWNTVKQIMEDVLSELDIPVEIYV
jgi:O-acetyl-ADP-ribose deacetylase (regulator of RNase III)